MAASPAPPTVVALLAMPDVTAATLYGFYDALSSAGRDWQMLHGQQPGAPPFWPLVVSHDGQPLLGANGVRIHADTSFAECPPPDVVCCRFASPLLPLSCDACSNRGRLPCNSSLLRVGYLQ